VPGFREGWGVVSCCVSICYVSPPQTLNTKFADNRTYIHEYTNIPTYPNPKNQEA